MISGRMEVNSLRLILEAKFGGNPLIYQSSLYG